MTMTSPTNMLWDLLSAQPPDEESIMQFLYDHPDCCSLIIDDKLAIHVAIEQCLSMDIIKQMLICYPACCSRMNSNGNLLLHELLLSKSSNISSNAIILIIDGNVDAVKAEDGNLLLHMECINQCRYDVIIKLLDIYPDAISIAVNENGYPLCCALASGHSTSDVIFYLLSLYPDAIRFMNKNGSLPLHIECHNLCRMDVIMKLCSSYPDSVGIANRFNNYPLHFAIYNQNCSSKIILYLISLYPDAVGHMNVDGFLPIHTESYHQCRYDVVLKLLDVYPGGISIAFSGNMALHFTLIRQQQPPIQVIQLLLDRYLDALKAVDHEGWLPVYRLFHKYHDQYISPYVSYSSNLSMQYKALIISMINNYPLTFDTIRNVAFMKNIQDDKPSAYRLLLLFVYDQIRSYDKKQHLDDHCRNASVYYDHYRDMNKQYRYPLLYLILQLSSLSSSQQVSYDMICAHHTCIVEATLRKMLLHMMSAAGKWSMDHSSFYHEQEYEMRYRWMKGDDLGCILLRKVMFYL